METSKITGKERRALKKELAQLKRLVNIFWYAHNWHKANGKTDIYNLLATGGL